MNDYIFIDTNLWLYIFIPDDQAKYIKLKALLHDWFNNNMVVISFQVINEITYNLKKKKFLEAEITDIIKTLNKNCIVSNFSYDILMKASELREKYMLSFWDSLIVSTAISTNCKTLYSEDMQSGMNIEGTKILNPLL